MENTPMYLETLRRPHNPSVLDAACEIDDDRIVELLIEAQDVNQLLAATGGQQTLKGGLYADPS